MGVLGNVECKIPGGSKRKMIGGERKRKRCERERDIRGCEGGKGGVKDRNNGMKDRRTV